MCSSMGSFGREQNRWRRRVKSLTRADSIFFASGFLGSDYLDNPFVSFIFVWAFLNRKPTILFLTQILFWPNYPTRYQLTHGETKKRNVRYTYIKNTTQIYELLLAFNFYFSLMTSHDHHSTPCFFPHEPPWLCNRSASLPRPECLTIATRLYRCYKQRELPLPTTISSTSVLCLRPGHF